MSKFFKFILFLILLLFFAQLYIAKGNQVIEEQKLKLEEQKLKLEEQKLNYQHKSENDGREIEVIDSHGNLIKVYVPSKEEEKLFALEGKNQKKLNAIIDDIEDGKKQSMKDKVLNWFKRFSI